MPPATGLAESRVLPAEGWELQGITLLCSATPDVCVCVRERVMGITSGPPQPYFPSKSRVMQSTADWLRERLVLTTWTVGGGGSEGYCGGPDRTL